MTVSLSSVYPPQSNGQTERKIQEIGHYLHTFCHSHQNSWNQLIAWAVYALNSLCQPSTDLTSFQCVFGYHPPLFPWSGESSDLPSVTHWFQESERVWDSAHQHLQRAVRRHKQHADVRRATTPIFHPGQKVWLSTRDIRLRLPCKKLSPRFIGPFPIIRQVNQVTYELQFPSQYRIHPTVHVSLLKPYHSPVSPVSTEPGPVGEPPLPIMLEDGTVYLVKEILSSWRRGVNCNIWWTGRGVAPRINHGSQEMTYSIPISWQSSTHLIPKIQRHMVGFSGPQERTVERGVLSQKLQDLLPISDPNHRSSDHTHLTIIH